MSETKEERDARLLREAISDEIQDATLERLRIIYTFIYSIRKARGT